jgi:hypothetical protein
VGRRLGGLCQAMYWVTVHQVFPEYVWALAVRLGWVSAMLNQKHAMTIHFHA